MYSGRFLVIAVPDLELQFERTHGLISQTCALPRHEKKLLPKKMYKRVLAARELYTFARLTRK